MACTTAWRSGSSKTARIRLSPGRRCCGASKPAEAVPLGAPSQVCLVQVLGLGGLGAWCLGEDQQLCMGQSVEQYGQLVRGGGAMSCKADAGPSGREAWLQQESLRPYTATAGCWLKPACLAGLQLT